MSINMLFNREDGILIKNYIKIIEGIVKQDL